MKVSSAGTALAIFSGILFFIAGVTGCKKEQKIKYPAGIFPDSITTLTDINSAYDDINTDIYTLDGYKSLIFSSNRNSSGGQFDLVQANISYTFDRANGNYTMSSALSADAFLTKLLTFVNDSKNQYGPYSLYSPTDGYEYLFYASENEGGNLDFMYTMNRPVAGSSLPEILGPYQATLLNTGGDDAYLSFDSNQDSMYFSSSAAGNFDIYLKSRSLDTSLHTWLSKPFSPLVKVDSINSTADDKCPYVYKRLMVFASNRPGGMGGFDLYYSLFKNGKWSSPVNFGPDVNTEYNEYRPVIGYNNSFTNLYMIFSSDRPGGKGGYDLYFKGI
jgi:hypothetical protein